MHHNANRGQHRQKPHTSQLKTNMEGNSEKLAELLHVKCFGRSLNLAAQRALKTPTVSCQLGRTRSIMAFFRKSTIASHALNEKQKLLNLPEHKLMTDVATRWNSPEAAKSCNTCNVRRKDPYAVFYSTTVQATDSALTRNIKNSVSGDLGKRYMSNRSSLCIAFFYMIILSL